VGKSTLARALADRIGDPVTIFDLEDSRALARLDRPMLR
jgi:deoxyadenosine/deoxycytidine kinase